MCGPGCLFVYKCKCTSVMLCVYKNIFCTKCTKGLWLARTTIRSQSTHPLWQTLHTHRDSMRTRLVKWATRRLHVSLHIHLISWWCVSAADWLMTHVPSTWRLFHLSSYLVLFWQDPSPLSQNSTLCKAPVCFHFTPMIVINENKWQIWINGTWPLFLFYHSCVSIEWEND